MAASYHPRRWGQQKPSVGTWVNWGHPLAKGLAMCVVLNEGGGFPIDIVSNRRAVLANTNPSAWAPSTMGVARRCDGATTGDKFVSVPSLSSSAGLSVCALAISNILPAGFRQVVRKNTAAVINLGQNSANCWYFAVQGQGGTEISDATRAVVVGEKVMLVGTSFGSVSQLYTNGVLGENISGRTLSDAAADINIGASVGGQFFNGWIGLVLMYGRALRQDEAQWLTAEPFAMLQPAAKSFRFPEATIIREAAKPTTGTPWDAVTGTPWAVVNE